MPAALLEARRRACRSSGRASCGRPATLSSASTAATESSQVHDGGDRRLQHHVGDAGRIVARRSGACGRSSISMCRPLLRSSTADGRVGLAAIADELRRVASARRAAVLQADDELAVLDGVGGASA